MMCPVDGKRPKKKLGYDNHTRHKQRLDTQVELCEVETDIKIAREKC